jgi:hypothetical protein
MTNGSGFGRPETYGSYGSGTVLERLATTHPPSKKKSFLSNINKFVFCYVV